MSGRVAWSVGCAFLAAVSGCGGDQVSLGNPPVETITPFDWNPALALVRGGDTIYAPRLTKLDAIDAQGASRTVAGMAYAKCASGSHEREWRPMAMDSGYPAFVADANTAFLSDFFCGVWSISVTDASRQGLVEQRVEPVPADNGKKRWGGEFGPRWAGTGYYPPAVALEGDDLIVCFTLDQVLKRVERDERRSLPDISEADHIEVWRAARDGALKQKLATFEPREGSCTHVLLDGASIFVTTNHTIYRLDRTGSAPVTIATDAGASFGWTDGYGLNGLVQDADHLYMLRRAVIERVAKDGSSRTVLVPSSVMNRVGLATDGKHAYWAEDYSLYRVAVTGGAPEKIVAGNKERGVYPMPPVITDEHIWFQLTQEVPSYSATDPETGETIDDITRQYSVVKVAR